MVSDGFRSCFSAIDKCEREGPESKACGTAEQNLDTGRDERTNNNGGSQGNSERSGGVNPEAGGPAEQRRNLDDGGDERTNNDGDSPGNGEGIDEGEIP